MTAEQPEYCDCQGFHDGSCHARRIAELEQQVKDLEARIENIKEHYSICLSAMASLMSSLIRHDSVTSKR